MRPVDKGNAPKTYTDHGQARHDLAKVVGYYCSYCEMPTWNMIEVEHIIPRKNGGAPLSWSNFLLSCKYCNTVKSNRNANRTGYLWPDIDNTDLAFEYSQANVIQAKSNLPANIQSLANSTIDLMGLDRIPGGVNEPTEADTRWISRQVAWNQASDALNRWNQAKIQVMAEQIASNAKSTGHYSIWIEVFKNEAMVITEIDNQYKQIALYKQLNRQGNRIIRYGGANLR
ncbi:HNH endonuclease [Halosquirtibacter xylanolyticus]|uniref:HNH endonuclease signature motif containing protein n=1 Tax=Halosquirtibacter xylanolyticus TaxID=3374599 RepID=UPI0037479EAD|nr:HNH endonuclease [Prolixibacteraceae bacterium]